MTKLTPDHPTVKAMIAPRMDVGCASDKAADRLNAALPHLTSATPENLALLRDTPVGRALMAEAWEEAKLDHIKRRYAGDLDQKELNIVRERIKKDNPYREAGS